MNRLLAVDKPPTCAGEWLMPPGTHLEDVDETARLILMESPRCSLLQFANELQEHCGKLDLTVMGDLWRKYRGFDGRTAPTHDVQTGQRRLVGR